MKHNDAIDVLVVSKDLGFQGGVVNYVGSVLSRFSGELNCVHFRVGKDPEKQSLARALLKPVQGLLDCICLVTKVRRENIPVVHLNPSLNLKSLLRDGLFALCLTLFTSTKQLVYVHGWDDRIATSFDQDGLAHSLFRLAFGSASQWLVLARRFKVSLECWGIPGERIDVASTLFDGTVFRQISWDRPPGSQRLLFMSRFVAEKGIYELMGAVARLRFSYPGLHLVMAGDGPENAGMRRWVADHQMENVVTFTGYLRDIDKVRAFSEADIFVFPTYYGEGCPVVLLEAMAAGLPVVTAPAGGVPDVFNHDINGVLLDVVSVASVEAAIRALLDDPEARERMSRENRRYAWDNFEAGVVTARLETVYRELIEGAART